MQTIQIGNTFGQNILPSRVTSNFVSTSFWMTYMDKVAVMGIEDTRFYVSKRGETVSNLTMNYSLSNVMSDNKR